MSGSDLQRHGCRCCQRLKLRPPPAAETGSNFWRSGQQDTRPAQGPKWTLGTARGKPFSASTVFSRHPHFSFIICCFSRLLCREPGECGRKEQQPSITGVFDYEQRKNVLRRPAQHSLAGKARRCHRPGVAVQREPHHRPQPGGGRGPHLQQCGRAVRGQVHWRVPRRAGQRCALHLSGPQRGRHPLDLRQGQDSLRQREG